MPEEFGGAGLNHVCYGLVAREVERVDSGYRSCMSVQSALVMHPIFTYGTAEQRKKYLPELARGEMRRLLRPDRDRTTAPIPASMITRAKKAPGGYRLNGAKTWITNSPIADIAVVWAKTDDDAIRGFMVERGMKGFSTPKIEGKFSLRASTTGEIVLDDCLVPEANMLPEREGPGRSVRLPEQGALRHRLGRHGRGRVLLARGAAIYARPQAVRPAAGRQPADPEKARRHADRDRARARRRAAARAADGSRARRRPKSMSLMKRNNCGKALDIARMARDMHGGNGVADEYNVIRHVMNLEAVNTYEGTHDIHALILGRAQTGIQAFN